MPQTFDVLTLGSEIPHYPVGEYAFLLPAFDETECGVVLAAVPSLLLSNCVQLCCVGAKAEALHDAIDDLLADKGKHHILTTYDADLEEACEYFVYAAGMSVAHLVALVAEHPLLISKLDKVREEYRRDSRP